METTEIIRILRQCGDCCRSSCEECPDYKKAEEGFRKDPEAKGFMWSCGGVLLDAADRLEELSELLNEWESVVHGKVEASKVPRPMRVEIVTDDFTNLEFARNNELWRKRYYCPSCGEKLIDDTYEKDRVYMSWCAARIREKMCCCPYCGTKVEVKDV
jgi:hypothetical protein